MNGRNYATETQVGPVDTTSLVPCGSNQIAVYDPDAGFAVSGVMSSATIDVHECATPTNPSTWGNVKAL